MAAAAAAAGRARLASGQFVAVAGGARLASGLFVAAAGGARLAPGQFVAAAGRAFPPLPGNPNEQHDAAIRARYDISHAFAPYPFPDLRGRAKLVASRVTVVY